MSYPTHTPAGALLSVDVGRRWTSIRVDRWPIDHARDDQASAVLALSEAAARFCFNAGRRHPINTGGGLVTWNLTVPAADTDEALAALLDVERGLHHPAELLTARYRTGVR